MATSLRLTYKTGGEASKGSKKRAEKGDQNLHVEIKELLEAPGLELESPLPTLNSREAASIKRRAFGELEDVNENELLEVASSLTVSLRSLTNKEEILDRLEKGEPINIIDNAPDDEEEEESARPSVKERHSNGPNEILSSFLLDEEGEELVSERSSNDCQVIAAKKPRPPSYEKPSGLFSHSRTPRSVSPQDPSQHLEIIKENPSELSHSGSGGKHGRSDSAP